MSENLDPNHRYDDQLAATNSAYTEVWNQLTKEEQTQTRHEVEALHLSYRYLSSDEAHIQYMSALTKVGTRIISERTVEPINFEPTHGDDPMPFPQPVDNPVENQYRPPRVLVTGSADWTNSGAVAEAILQTWLALDRRDITVITRGQATGCDVMALAVAAQQGFRTIPIASRPEDGERAERIRNRELLLMGVDVALVFTRNLNDSDRHLLKLLHAGEIPTFEYSQIDPGGIVKQKNGAHSSVG